MTVPGPGGNPRNDRTEQAHMDIEMARTIFLGLIAVVGVGGIIDMFRP
ncbi:MAG: hypothetical protein ACRDKW_02055 [Actinomycetota bacterium]